MNESFRAHTAGYIATNQSLGTVFDKALFRGYTGPDFETRTEQPSWQGFMGPTLRGEVGDMIEVCPVGAYSPTTATNNIKILFVNKMETFYATMHSMGLFYPKEYEGALYWDGPPPPVSGDAVAPGECAVYKW